MKTITCKPNELFIRLATALTEVIYGQLIWYKLPFEDHKDQKSLGNGDENFEKMCEAGRWLGMADVFLVNSIEHPHEVEFYEPCDEEIRVEKNVVFY